MRKLKFVSTFISNRIQCIIIISTIFSHTNLFISNGTPAHNENKNVKFDKKFDMNNVDKVKPCICSFTLYILDL